MSDAEHPLFGFLQAVLIFISAKKRASVYQN
jgi:hypothetical protein